MSWWDHDLDLQVEHFNFYNLLQNIDSLKDIFKSFLDSVWPLIWGASPFCLISKERPHDFKYFLFNSSSEILYGLRDISRYNFRGQMKSAYPWKH